MPDNDIGAGQSRGPDPAVVGSEFAEIKVAIDRQGNGPRLRLEDLRTGRVRCLDALELETIIWLPEGHLRKLLDPSADRWREDPGR
jgi:hypothetical protein